jgi:pimeloyl-ACP methyl ester carboxylesterase
MCSSFGCLGSRSCCFRQGRFRALVQSISERTRPGTVKPEELERYRAAWSAPGALTAMLNWYRAFLRKDLPASTNCRIASRVLLIWGERDSYCVRDLAEASLRLCDNGRAEYVKNATHWYSTMNRSAAENSCLNFSKARARRELTFLRQAMEKALRRTRSRSLYAQIRLAKNNGARSAEVVPMKRHGPSITVAFLVDF